MTDALLNMAKTLNKEIMLSDIYKQYIESKKKVDSNPSYKDMIEKLRSEQNVFELKKLNSEYIDSGEEFSFLNMYSDISIIPECRAYLLNEVRLLKLLSGICNEIFNEIDIEVNL